jgi:hypothetical protein
MGEAGRTQPDHSGPWGAGAAGCAGAAEADDAWQLLGCFGDPRRHGSQDFDKFKFFKTHYAGVDLGALDLGTVRGYATWLAVRAWQELGGGGGRQEL